MDMLTPVVPASPLPWGQSEIEAVLPHRPPFLWLSRVLACVPGETVVAQLDVAEDLPLFQGHFPDYPVLPGVILMEALAQAAGIALLTDARYQGKLGLFAGIDGARFRRQVRPGETVTLEARIEKASKRLCVAQVRALVGEEVAAEATQKYVLAPAP